MLSFIHYCSLRKKFFRSQAQRAGNRQILEARKKLHKPEHFCQFMGGLENLIRYICQRRLLQWHPFVSLIKRICIYLPLFTLKERNSGLFCPIFLKFTFDNFTSPVGLAILKFYLPGPNFTSLGHRACTIFRRLLLTSSSSIHCNNDCYFVMTSTTAVVLIFDILFLVNSVKSYPNTGILVHFFVCSNPLLFNLVHSTVQY